MNASIDDERLMAYADDQLDGAERSAVEDAVKRNPELAKRVADHRALRDRLQANYAAVLSESVPERLRTLLAAPTVADLEQAREARAKRMGSPLQWTALAASLSLGIVIGRTVLNGEPGVVADAQLARALAIPTEAQAQDSVTAGMSYRSKSGAYCRVFADARQASDGIACHEDGVWRIRMLLPASGSASEYRTANSRLQPALVAQIDADIVGEPLDAEAEAEAAKGGWKSTSGTRESRRSR